MSDSTCICVHPQIVIITSLSSGFRLGLRNPFVSCLVMVSGYVATNLNTQVRLGHFRVLLLVYFSSVKHLILQSTHVACYTSMIPLMLNGGNENRTISIPNTSVTYVHHTYCEVVFATRLPELCPLHAR